VKVGQWGRLVFEKRANRQIQGIPELQQGRKGRIATPLLDLTDQSTANARADSQLLNREPPLACFA